AGLNVVFVVLARVGLFGLVRTVLRPGVLGVLIALSRAVLVLRTGAGGCAQAAIRGRGSGGFADLAAGERVAVRIGGGHLGYVIGATGYGGLVPAILEHHQTF